jgi:hypothetical protein
VDVVRVSTGRERRGEVFRITVDERLDRSATASHSYYWGEESDGGLPAGASCDALDDVCPARPVAASPEAGFDVLQLRRAWCRWGVRCHAYGDVGRLCASGVMGTSSPKFTVSVRVKGPASSSLGLRNGPLEVQAVTNTQTAARLRAHRLALVRGRRSSRPTPLSIYLHRG